MATTLWLFSFHALEREIMHGTLMNAIVVQLSCTRMAGCIVDVNGHYYRMRHWSMPKIAKNLGLFAAWG